MAKQKTERRLKAENDGLARSQLFHVLAKVAGKEAGKAARDLLQPGSSVPCQILINATIAGRSVVEEIVGTLNVNHDSTTNSSVTPELDQLVGLLLHELPKKRRLELLARLPDHWTASKSLPAVPEERTNEAKELLSRLRSRESKVARGSVVFTREAAGEEAAA